MSNLNINRAYEDLAWSMYSQNISSADELRISETLSLIPEYCSSILEVGCGNGVIINRLLPRDCYLCGLDISGEALKQVKVDKAKSSAGSLPFRDKSFDLILCCEVLEHLPFQVYALALKEIERVARKHIIISVPHNQDLKLTSVHCPYCGCTFDTYRHIRSFNTESIKKLFVDFNPDIIKTCGNYKADPTIVERTIKNLFHSEFPIDAICPQCGYFKLTGDRSIMTHEDEPDLRNRLWRLATKCIPKKNKWRWIMASYHRK